VYICSCYKTTLHVLVQLVYDVLLGVTTILGVSRCSWW
jgi:hypothetical protein